MKKFILLLVAGFSLMTVSAQARASEELAADAMAVQQCSAQAFCPQTGRVVACTVYSDPVYGQSCTWESRIGYGVRCTGWDVFGRWVVYQDYCIY